jgi:hypothetical protein
MGFITSGGNISYFTLVPLRVAFEMTENEDLMSAPETFIQDLGQTK